METKAWLSGLFFIYLHVLAAQPAPLVLPFELSANLILVRATADGQEGYFILDTGLGPLVLNSRYFKGRPGTRVFYDIHGQASPIQESEVELRLGWQSFGLARAEIVDLRKIETRLGTPVLGHLGVDVFRNVELVIDYLFNEITIYDLTGKGERRSGRELHHFPTQTLPLLSNAALPVVEAYSGNNRLRLGLDTGAGVNVLEERRLEGAAADLRSPKMLKLSGYGYREQEVTVGDFEGIRLGNRLCPAMRTAVFSLTPYNRQRDGGSPIDGLLGFEFLKQYRVAINFPKMEIRLWDAATVQQQYLASRQSAGSRFQMQDSMTRRAGRQ